MAPKIFLTGSTGYIGGDTLYALYNKHSDYEIAVLVRSEEKGKPVKAAFPNVRLVIGDLDSSQLIEEEAAKADVIIRELSHASSMQLPLTYPRHSRCL